MLALPAGFDAACGAVDGHSQGTPRPRPSPLLALDAREFDGRYIVTLYSDPREVAGPCQFERACRSRPTTSRGRSGRSASACSRRSRARAASRRPPARSASPTRRPGTAVSAMNNLFGWPLVEAQAGGRKGGGARLSPAGRRVVAGFERIEGELARIMRTLEPELERDRHLGRQSGVELSDAHQRPQRAPRHDRRDPGGRDQRRGGARGGRQDHPLRRRDPRERARARAVSGPRGGRPDQGAVRSDRAVPTMRRAPRRATRSAGPWSGASRAGSTPSSRSTSAAARRLPPSSPAGAPRRSASRWATAPAPCSTPPTSFSLSTDQGEETPCRPDLLTRDPGRRRAGARDGLCRRMLARPT